MTTNELRELVENLRNEHRALVKVEWNEPNQIIADRFTSTISDAADALSAILEASGDRDPIEALKRPVTGYSITDDPEYGFSDLDGLAEYCEFYSGEVASVYGLTPWRPDPTEFYATVPEKRMSAREWVDGGYTGTFDVIGPFKTSDEAKQSADECVKERKAEWEAQQ